MSARIELERAQAAALVGGALVMLGAVLPWLTLYAGLQRYGGLIGLHGRLLFAGGAVATAAGVAALRVRRRWLRWGTALLGLALLAFTGWLLVRLDEMLHRDLSAMLVPRAGPGLFVGLLGAALVAAGPAIGLVRGGPER
jgi:hypothetical protein